MISQDNLDKQIREKVNSVTKLPASVRWNADKGWNRYPKTYGHRSIRKKIFWSSLAAAVILAFVLFPDIWRTGAGTDTLHLSTNNSKADIILNDGSRISLNTYSSIDIDQERNTMEFQGEAYFELTDKTKYSIHSRHLTLIAGQSKFNLKTREKANSALLTMVQGSAHLVWETDIKLNVPVTEGTETTIVPQVAMIQQPISDENFLAWKTETLHFDGVPLYSLMDKLMELDSLTIDLSVYDLRYCMLSADFNTISPEYILNKLPEYIDCSVTRTNNGYLIAGKGCL